MSPDGSEAESSSLPINADVPPAVAEQLASERKAVLRRYDVSRETSQRLDAFVRLLLTWQQRINLISPATLPEIWSRHIGDSIGLYRAASPVARWVDLGSGGGLPGIVLAIMNADCSEANVDLVESSGKKAAFLRTAMREIGLNGLVHATRIETAGAVIASADAVSARALAPLTDLLAMVAPHLGKHAGCFFPKGRSHEQEISEASAQWRFTVVKHQSDLQEGSVILEVRDITPR